MRLRQGALGATLGLALLLPSPVAAAEAAPARGEPAVSAATRESGPPSRDPAGEIERAFTAPAASLAQRVARTRRTALQHGLWNLDAAARAVLAGAAGGDAMERAESAVRLSPDLPAARIALARAHWLQAEEPLTAIRTAASALLAIPRHLEASVWFGGSALYLLSLALIGGGLLSIGLAGAMAFPHAAHDLGDTLSRTTPAFARVALLAVALLIPLWIGEGALGLALGLLAIGLVYGSVGQRIALVLAAAGLLAGLYPLPRLAGALLSAFPADPVADAAYATAQGFPTPVDVARLEAAADVDPLAARAMAMRARRAGRLFEADAQYAVLREIYPGDPVLANNAANVRLALGHMESALALYRVAVGLDESPVVLFNLSQAHGLAFQVDELTRALERAQAIGGRVVAELTDLQGAQPKGFVVDLPLPNELLWRRLLASRAGDPVAAELRAPLAPGGLGRSRELAAAGFLSVAVAAIGLGWPLRASRWCTRCGRRRCPRCHEDDAQGDTCPACEQIFRHPEGTDRTLRIARINALRRRERRQDRITSAASLLVPGCAGWLAQRPFRGWLGAVCFCVAAVFVRFHEGLLPDPLVAGGAAPLGFLLVAALGALGYAIAVATSLAARRSG